MPMVLLIVLVVLISVPLLWQTPGIFLPSSRRANLSPETGLLPTEYWLKCFRFIMKEWSAVCD
jgi:hypothetical protein